MCKEGPRGPSFRVDGLMFGNCELKNGLSRYLDRVQAGEEVIVTDRGRPVARLSALDATDDRLAELVAAGVCDHLRARVAIDRSLASDHRET